MAAKAKPLEREKIAIVHVAAHQLRMTDDEYRALLLSAAGVSSSRGLNEAGFRALMLRFEQLGFTHSKGKGKAAAPVAPVYGARYGMASPAQVELVRKLWALWHGQGDARESARAMGRWLESRYHVSDLRFVDVVTAQKALEGLKAMTRRKASAAASPTAGGKP